jgi:cytochrome c553
MVRGYSPCAKIVVSALIFIGIHHGALAQSDDAAPVPDTIAQRVSPASCRAAQGEGTDNAYFPRLAGKPAGCPKNQLVAFKNGRRHYPPMNYLLEFLPDDYLGAMAEYFAAQCPPLPTPAVPDVSAAILAQGKALVTEGDANRGVPACQSCHGTALTGMEPGIPGLVGARRNDISEQMRNIARRMTAAEIAAVAEYYGASAPK